MCVRKLGLIPAVISQNITIKIWLVCVKSEKNYILVFPQFPWVHEARRSFNVSSPPLCRSQQLWALAQLSLGVLTLTNSGAPINVHLSVFEKKNFLLTWPPKSNRISFSSLQNFSKGTIIWEFWLITKRLLWKNLRTILPLRIIIHSVFAFGAMLLSRRCHSTTQNCMWVIWSNQGCMYTP